MSAKERILNILQSGATMTAGASILATGGYVIYKDRMRYPRMHKAYSTGNVLSPMTRNQHESPYFRRPTLESKIGQVLSSDLSNEYYLINGDVGTGKTRTVLSVIRNMMERQGAEGHGAPIYVNATQGKSFPDTLASAVNFSFDEHISFKFFLDFVLRIHSFPQRDDHHKLTRVLDAIEKSAFQYLNKTGKPVVLVVDGVNNLSKDIPGSLEKLQEKAKLWADTNSVKVVFISNDEQTEMQLQEHSSNWSRAATPLCVGDLSEKEAVEFLTGGHTNMKTPAGNPEKAHESEPSMTTEHALRIYHFVGGRMHHLLSFKRDWRQGISFEQTALEMKAKEREKFINVSRNPKHWKVVDMIMKSPMRRVSMTKLIEATSEEHLFNMMKNNIISVERRGSGIVCRMECKLTEYVVEQFYTEV